MPDPEIQLLGLDTIRILYAGIERIVTRKSGENDNQFARRATRHARSFSRRTDRLLRKLSEGCFLISIDEIAVEHRNVNHSINRQKGESDPIFTRRAKEEAEVFRQSVDDILDRI